jgi:hypothetical protein
MTKGKEEKPGFCGRTEVKGTECFQEVESTRHCVLVTEK